MNKINKLLPIITTIVVAIVFIGFYMLMTKKPDSTIATKPKPQHEQQTKTSLLGSKKKPKSAVDQKQDAIRDNYLETTRTVISKQDEFEEKLGKVESELKDIAELKKLLEKEREETRKSKDSNFDKIAKKLESRFDKKFSSLAKTANGIAADIGKRTSSAADSLSTKTNGIPSGLGFDDLPLGNGQYAAPESKHTAIPRKEEYVTIKPTYAGVYALNSKAAKKAAKNEIEFLSESSFEYDKNPSIFDEDDSKNNRKGSSKKNDPAIPFYTINATATLFSNTSLTAMLGVVPYKGEVRDPYRFKVITGTQNLSSNGHRLDQVKNIVWTGVLRGNREMSCVTGVVDTVSLVFWDGTISTTSASKGQAEKITEGLGYISDRRGNPCISGTYISNASQYLSDRILASGLAGAAEAAAASETTQVTDGSGNVVSFVSGESKDFIAGKTVSGMFNETAQYVRDRQADAIDVVYVPSGQDLIIHVEKRIPFDYDPNGRKLNHAQTQSNTVSYFD